MKNLILSIGLLLLPCSAFSSNWKWTVFVNDAKTKEEKTYRPADKEPLVLKLPQGFSCIVGATYDRSNDLYSAEGRDIVCDKNGVVTGTLASCVKHRNGSNTSNPVLLPGNLYGYDSKFNIIFSLQLRCENF